MTLDEIITGMAHTGTRSATQILLYHIPEKCALCQLLAFRAEMEEMAKRWDDVYWLRQCAAELRAKIGEGK